MRKSFTRLSSVLVLLFLSVQLVFAASSPTLDPTDGGTASSTAPTFTMTFSEDVFPGYGGTVGLYTDGLATPLKVIQVTTATVGTQIFFDGKEVTFSFSGITPLNESTAYDVLVEDLAIEDANGDLLLSGDLTWDFNTPDLTGPALAEDGLTPADDAEGVGTSSPTTLEMEFTENIFWADDYDETEPALGDFAIYKSTSDYDGEEGGDLVTLNGPSSLSISGNTLTIEFSMALEPSTDYYVRVKGDIIEDVAEFAYGGINDNTSWSFTTKAPEEITPAIYADNASGSLWTNDKFYIDFTEDMFTSKDVAVDVDDIPEGAITLKDADGNLVDFTLSYSGTNDEFTLTPDDDLSSASYTVAIAAGIVRDADNNPNEAADATFDSGDWNAPVIESLTTTNHGGTTFDILVQTDEVSTVKYIVVKEGTPAPILGDVIGYSNGTDENKTGTTRIHRVASPAGTAEGNLNLWYSIKSGSDWNEYEIFAEGVISVDNSDFDTDISTFEVLKRVDNLPETNGASYTVYAVAYDASTTGEFDPDYSSTSTPIVGNITETPKSTPAHTIDIVMPTVWFDGDSLDYMSLLNKDSLLGNVGSNDPMIDLARKGQIYLNFNEGIRMADGTSIDEDDIPLFVTVEDNSTEVGFSAEYDADDYVVTLWPDSAYKSGSTVTVTIAPTMIEDMSGNELQPAVPDLLDQNFTVETYSPVFSLFSPAHGDIEVEIGNEYGEGGSFSVKFNDFIYVPRDDEPTVGDMKRLNNDPVSNYYAGRYFEIREGDYTDATAGDEPVKSDFSFEVVYNEGDTTTTVTITREYSNWQSEYWYYVEVEGDLLDANRYTIADGSGLTHPASGPFSEITTNTNDNQTASFKITDIESPEVVFYEASVSTVPGSLANIDGANDVATTETIGVYVDEYVNLGFADHIDFTAPGAGLTADANAMRRYFRIMKGDEEVKFDVVNLNVAAGTDYLYMELDPYYETENGYSEGPNFEEGESYKVYYISTELEGDVDGESYEDEYNNYVYADSASFSIVSTTPSATVNGSYSPMGVDVDASTASLVFTFDELYAAGSVGPAPTIEFDVDGVATPATLTDADADINNGQPTTITYDITGLLSETETYRVTVADDAFVFDGGATWPPAAETTGSDSTWTFTTVDGTAPVVDLLIPADDATDVPLTTDLVISFDEDVDPVVGKKLYLWESGVSEIYTARIDASMCEHIGGDSIKVPNSVFGSDLKYNTEYHVIVAPGFVEDLSGNPFAGIQLDDVWNFTTGSDPAPSYASFSPKDVVDDVNALNNDWKITFSEPVTPVANMSIIVYEDNGGTLESMHNFDVDNPNEVSPTSGYSETFTLNMDVLIADLEWGKTYRIEVQAGAYQDTDGNPIYVCDPTIGGPTTVGNISGTPAEWVITFDDLVAPTATFWPEDEEENIPYNAYLYVKFSEPVAFDNGTAIITDPTVISQNIPSFITLNSTKTGGNVATKVEFVDNSKKILRITPLDPAGYEYNSVEQNASMQTDDTYVLSIAATSAGLTLTDTTGVNTFSTDFVTFYTEDITKPVINSFVENDTDANSTVFDIQVGEDATAYVYVMEGTPSTAPTATEIIDNAQWSADVDAGDLVTTDEISLGETEGEATYTAYAVAVDDEVDRYASPDPQMWMFTETTDGVDRIRDILPAPNTSLVAGGVGITTCDDDAPYVLFTDPAHDEEQIALDANIYLVFNEGVNYANTTNGFVKLRKAKNNVQVDAAVTVVSGAGVADTIQITPSNNLDQETDYYVEIDRYAIEDLATCGANAFHEWVGKDSLLFTTLDNVAPVLDSTDTWSPVVATKNQCVDPAIDEFNIYITEKNPISKNGADNRSVLIYRGTDATGTLLEVIPVGGDRVVVDSENRVVTVDVSDFVFLGDDQYYVEVAAGSVVDSYDNESAVFGWTFETLDNVAPVVSWEVHKLNYFFNNSTATEVGVDSYWSLDDDGLAGGVASNVSSHAALKIEFNEDVQIQTSTDNWVALANYDATPASTEDTDDNVLVDAEIFANLNIGELVYDEDADESQLFILGVTSNSIIVGFNVEYSTLYDEATLGAGTLSNAYVGSLALAESSYAVTLNNNNVADMPTCTNTINTVESPDVVTIETRDDTAPQMEISACGSTCVDKDGTITLTFDKPVVKSSYDISWLDNESNTYANLLLDDDDIEDTADGKYLELYKLDPADSSRIEVVEVVANVVDNYTIEITPAESFASDTVYQIVFNKWTVKEYIVENPSGTLFEGDSCIFNVYDYLAPEMVALSPVDNVTDLTTTSINGKLTVEFNEKVQLGAGTLNIRRENGQIFEQVDAEDCSITGTAKNVLEIPVTNNGGALEDFTMYYVEMPDGFVTDTVACAGYNNFAGFSASLDSETGEFVAAGWNFRTADGTPPELLTNVEGELVGLYPVPGDSNIARNSDLVMTFDENIIMTANPNQGIVIYYDNGEDTEVDFGNAIEFIPWGDSRIEVSGSDLPNKFTSDVVTVDPDTQFDDEGTYYIRVAGNNIEDQAGNFWSDSNSELVNEIKDEEWKFTITRDVEPVLVATNPAYDGVGAPEDYNLAPDDTYVPTEGFVISDLSMTFEDGNGNPLDVAKGDASRMFRIYEYVYNPSTLQWDDKLWKEFPITDESITVSGNVVTVNDVKLRDGINGDSVYYVTVDPGAINNGIEGSEIFWAGISNGFRWRFQTPSDEVFVDGYEILSPKGESATNLTIEAADSLIVDFNEGISSLGADAFGQIVITDLDGDSIFATIDVAPENCVDSMLYVDISDILVDEKNYAITVQKGTFGDTATVANPNFAFGGSDEWFFHTGDNTPPVPDTTLLYAGEDCAPSEFVMEMIFDETLGVDIAQGQITFTDTSGADVIDPIAAESLVIDSTLKVVTAQVAGLPDTTDITVTLSAGLFVDRDTISPLENPEVSWTFRTGDNSGPVPTLVEPSAIVETTEVEIQITFNEPVNDTQGWVNVNGNPVLFTTEDDTIYSALVSDELLSDQVNVISFSDSSFFDTAVCGSNVVDAATTLEFDVADIDNPVAEYYPNGEYDGYYKGIELLMMFNDNVSPVADKDIYIFDADTDEPVDTIAAEEFTSEDDSTYAALVDLYYGSFYVLADSGSFVDSDAVTFAQDYNGIVEDTVWTFDVVDTYFDPCVDGFTPARAEKGVETTTTISINFCGEESIMPAVRGDRYVTIGDQSDDQVLDENYFIFEVADSMIEGSTLTIEVDGLKENTTYSIIVAPGAVTDEAGNEFEGVTSANDWIFTTGDFTAPVATLEAGSAIEGDDEVATMTSTENGTLYLVEENVDADVTAMEAAVDNNTAVAITAIANTDMLVSVSELAAGTYNAVAVDEDGNTSERSDNAFVIESSVELTIAEIQGDGDATPYEGEIVKTSGTVTGIDENGAGFFMQDANEARSGIYVYDSGLAAEVGIGTDVKITATATEYYSLTQLSDVISYEFTGKIVDPVAINITASEIGEDYEGVLVKVDSLKTTGMPSDADNTEGEWYTADTENDVDVTIDEQLFTYVPDAGQRYNITGVVNYTWDEYKLAPRNVNDIDFVSGIKMLDINIDIYPNPFDTYVKFDVSRDVEITKAVITNIAGQLVKQVDYPENTIRTDELRSGVYFISLQTEEGIAKTERIIKR